MSNLPFVNITAWAPDQVGNWLRGLDEVILPHVQSFLNAKVTGKQLLFLNHSDLCKLGVVKLGHRELILEAVEMLHTLYYDIEYQTVQTLALQLTCKACSLRNDIISQLPSMLQGAGIPTDVCHGKVPLSILSAVSDVIGSIKQIVSWLDRSPFDTSDEYIAKRDTLIAHGLELLDATQTTDPLACEKEIMEKCRLLVKFGEKLVQESHDSLMIQPVSLEITTIRKKPEDDLGMHIQSLYNGTHIIGAIKEQSPADLCGKVEEGDEVIQVNYQTVVGWQLQKLVTALKDNKKEVTLTLKKRPHHVNPFGPHMRRKKVQKNVKQSTFPKDFGRKSREEKNERAPLKDFLNSMLAPYNKESSQEPDSDNENDVFQNTLGTPSSLQIPLEPTKQRRATVSGGSPPNGKRNSLDIINLPSTGRPKSYTISSPSNEVRSLLGSPASDLMSPQLLDDFAGEKSPTKESTDTLSPDSTCGNIQTALASPASQTTPVGDDISDASRSLTVETVPKTALPTSATSTATLTLTPPNATECSEIAAPSAMKQSNSESNILLQIPGTEVHLRQRNNSDLMVNLGTEQKMAAQLLSVRRIDSQRRAELYDLLSPDDQDQLEEKRQVGTPDPPDGATERSYTVNIVGGRPQRTPQTDNKESPSQSPHGIRRPKHLMRNVGAIRRISCKDLGRGDCQGWLWKKKEGLLHNKWVKRWFILKQKNLFYYKSPEDEKAKGVIHLPGFRVSPAPEVKSKKFAFKAHHSGTTFYFASESQNDMAKWMNKMGLAAIVYDTQHITTTAGFIKPDVEGHSNMESEHVYYSESDDENDPSSLSPEMMKHSLSPSPVSSHSSREDITETDVERDDLIQHFTRLRQADLDISGQNAVARRTSTLSKPLHLDITNVRELELHRKYYSLRRTLKAKQHELSVINQLVDQQPVTASRLEHFKRTYPDIIESLTNKEVANSSSDESYSE